MNRKLGKLTLTVMKIDDNSWRTVLMMLVGNSGQMERT